MFCVWVVTVKSYFDKEHTSDYIGRDDPVGIFTSRAQALTEIVNATPNGTWDELNVDTRWQPAGKGTAQPNRQWILRERRLDVLSTNAGRY